MGSTPKPLATHRKQEGITSKSSQWIITRLEESGGPHHQQHPLHSPQPSRQEVDQAQRSQGRELPAADTSGAQVASTDPAVREWRETDEGKKPGDEAAAKGCQGLPRWEM